MAKPVTKAIGKLKDISTSAGLQIETKEFAEHLDKQDELSSYRDKFYIPKNATIPGADVSIVNGEDECIYLCGNSLGLCPKTASLMIEEEMKKWKECGVIGHHVGKIPWAVIGDDIMHQVAGVVGALPHEVNLMNGLSANLHFMMVSFYTPTEKRHKIMLEGGSFPSDIVAMKSQIAFHGYDPESSVLQVFPRAGEHTLRTDDILQTIEKEGDEVALILFSGVQFYTGQAFDIHAITEAGQRRGCRVGFDLAHAVGNIEMKLHEWNVDFACWCTYKYLNGGPGAIAGAYIHERHDNDTNMKRFTGWWGVDCKKRFEMDNDDLPFIPGVKGYALSNPPVMSMLPVIASYEIFQTVGMDAIVKKQRLLTGLLEELFYKHIDNSLFEILTPTNTQERGCQLSVSFTCDLEKVFHELERRGVVCDMRRFRVMRIAPCPLYNSFIDVYKFIMCLKNAIQHHL